MVQAVLSSFRFLRMYFHLWAHHQISLRAAALTYAFILALIPLLVVCLSGGSLFINMNELSTKIMGFLTLHLAPGSAAKVSALLTKLLAKVHFKALGYVGFAALLITCLLLLSGIENSINRIWSIRRKKDLWKRVLIYNMLLVLGPASLSLSLSTVTLIGSYFPKYAAKASISAYLVNALFVSLIYKIFPNKKVHWKAAIFSGFLAAGVSELAKWGYAGYTKSLFYNEVYGSLAILPLFLIWIYLSWNIFLGGSLLSYMIQHNQSFRLNPKKLRAAPPA